MKAAVNLVYGSPDVVSIVEVDKPVHNQKQVLVKIFATTVNRTDCGFRSAEYFIIRFFNGFIKPKYTVLGTEFSGVIEEVGSRVLDFKPGDEVFGFSEKKFGCHAEYLAICADEAISKKPKNIDLLHAASISEGAFYALNIIRASKIKAGQSALVYGATGAIGSAAVQILKYMKVDVSAVCNAKNIALLKSLGVDEIFDYQTEDFTQSNMKYDFIFDAVGKISFKTAKPLLYSNGIYISTELGKNCENIMYSIITPFFFSKKVRFPMKSIKKEDVFYLKKLVEQGFLMPVIDKIYSFDKIVEAYKYVETRQKTGNVLIKI